ncbi:MAG: hypothetical protein F6K24_07465 [Okeania sp. SIO2D1]|nr:hypothetical protein [Okeania sp. SIO2D1]
MGNSLVQEHGFPSSGTFFSDSLSAANGLLSPLGGVVGVLGLVVIGYVASGFIR